jgi:acetoin utilization deacetylase AcuC-like enzyme
MPDTLYLSHPDCLRHRMDADHPECPERVTAIEDRLRAAGLFDFLQREEAPRASRDQLERVHDARYVRHILESRLEPGEQRHLDPDTYMNAHTADAALRAAGAVVWAVDRILQGEARAAFCNVRPPGHHAVRGEAMGFCFFNNVAVGARHAIAAHGLERVAIIDFDVHFGNGTADIFEHDASVMLCSSYQYPLYPLAGPAPGNERLINVPLAPGSGGAEFRAAVAAAWFGPLAAFRPELVFFSAGFDAHAADPLASLRLREDDFAWVTREVLRITQASAANRAVSTLEGGYDLNALGRSAAAHVAVLMDPARAG